MVVLLWVDVMLLFDKLYFEEGVIEVVVWDGFRKVLFLFGLFGGIGVDVLFFDDVRIFWVMFLLFVCVRIVILLMVVFELFCDVILFVRSGFKVVEGVFE